MTTQPIMEINHTDNYIEKKCCGYAEGGEMTLKERIKALIFIEIANHEVVRADELAAEIMDEIEKILRSDQFLDTVRIFSKECDDKYDLRDKLLAEVHKVLGLRGRNE